MMRTKRVQPLPIHAAGLLGVAVMLSAAPSVSYAEQFVLFDVSFTFTKADADNSRPSKSHYYVRGDAINPKRHATGRPRSTIATERSTSAPK